jgi:hypothetical protein
MYAYERSKTKMWATSVIFKKLPIERKFAQSVRPALQATVTTKGA